MSELKDIVDRIQKKDFDKALELCEFTENSKNKHIILNFKGVIYLLKNNHYVLHFYSHIMPYQTVF